MKKSHVIICFILSVFGSLLFVSCEKIPQNMLLKEDSCDFSAADDFHILGDDPVNSETTSLAKVDVLKNDQTCNSLKELSITKNADYGNAYVEDNYLYYSYPRQELYTDSLRYQICNTEGICSEATVRFGIE